MYKIVFHFIMFIYLYIKYKQYFVLYYRFVECDECGRRLHMICVLHFEQIWPNG